jgi:hypothetical protein
MDKVSCIAVFLSFVFLFFLHHLLRRRAGGDSHGKSKSMRLPPSPRGALPLLGHLHLIRKPFHVALSRLAERHGPAFSLRLGFRNAVVVTSPAIARECFTEHDVTFANRPRIPSQMLATGVALGTANYGPHWRNLRRVATVQLLSAHRVACMSPVICAEVRAMARRIHGATTTAAAAPGGAARVELRGRLFELSLSVLMEAIAQTKATTQPSANADTDMSVEAQVFKQVIDEVFPRIGSVWWDHLPALQWLDVFGVRNKIQAAVRRRDVVLRRILDAERRRLDGDGIDNEKKSMMAVLLTLQRTQPEVYTDTMITAFCSVSD